MPFLNSSASIRSFSICVLLIVPFSLVQTSKIFAQTKASKNEQVQSADAIRKAETDSLQALLIKATEDTTKINLRLEIGEVAHIYRIGYWDSLAKDAGSLNMKEITADASNKIGVLYMKENDFTKALEWYEKSLKLSEELGDKLNISNSLNNIGFVYDKQKNIEKALEANHKSLKVKEAMEDRRGMANSYNNIGNVYLHNDEPFKALEWYQKSLKLREQISDKKGTANSQYNIALVYKNINNLTKALEYFNKCKMVREESEDKAGISHVLMTMGEIYEEQNDVTKALESYTKAIAIAKETDNKNAIAQFSYTVGLLFENEASKEKASETISSKLKEALGYHVQSLKVKEEIGEKKEIAKSLTKIGSVYINQAEHLENVDSINGKLSLALELLNNSLKLNEEIDSKEGIANTLNLKGEIYLKKKNYKDAEECFSHSLKISQENAILVSIRDASNALSKVYSSNSADNKKSIEMKELSELMNDSIKNIESRLLVFNKRIQAEFEKQESESIITLDLKNAADEKKQTMIKTSIIVGSVFTLILIIVLIRRRKRVN